MLAALVGPTASGKTEVGIALYRQGFDFCCYSGDVWVLRDALAAAITTLRKGCMQ